MSKGVKFERQLTACEHRGGSAILTMLRTANAVSNIKVLNLDKANRPPPAKSPQGCLPKRVNIAVIP